ncbi:hypothetical protein D9M69_625120 [compost metagenome]
MPLMTCTSMPAARRCSTSSPPRPKMNGSPPFRRTTTSPSLAAMTMSFSMKACGVLLQPPRLPTCTMRALWRAWASTASLTRSSTSSTVAALIAFTALSVSNSGSPGPAPTSATVPGRNSDGVCMGWGIMVLNRSQDVFHLQCDRGGNW